MDHGSFDLELYPGSCTRSGEGPPKAHGATHDARQILPAPASWSRQLCDGTPRGAAVGQAGEVDANHYGVMAHPEALDAIDDFLASVTPCAVRR